LLILLPGNFEPMFAAMLINCGKYAVAKTVTNAPHNNANKGERRRKRNNRIIGKKAEKLRTEKI